MKLALRYIPAEVWVDIFIFPWITRKELGRIVHKFGKRYIVEILQYCLHERGKRTLDTVDLTKEASIPQTPMPENIMFFKKINVYDFDAQTFDFLRRISALFTTNDVNLHFPQLAHDLTNLRITFDHLAPLLHGIHSLDFNHNAIPLVQQYFAPKLAQVKMLSIKMGYGELFDPATTEADINFSMDWLTSGERDITGPKFLEIYIFCPKILPQFYQAVQQQFLSANKPVTFVIVLIRIHKDNPDDQIANFHLENNIGEQLHGEHLGDEYVGYFEICRHQVGTERAKLEEWAEETHENHHSDSSGIYLLKYGPIGGNAGANGVNKAGDGEEENQPSTSG